MASRLIDLVGLAGLALVAGITVPPTTAAGLDPAPKCEAAKLDASAKAVRCVANLSSQAIRKADAVDAARLARCFSRFGEGFARSEVRAAGNCPTEGDSASVEAMLDACIDSVVAYLGGVPGAGGAEARCQSGKTKEAGKYAQCTFKAASKGVKTGLAPDYVRCGTKLSGRWARLEAGASCLTSGDLASVQAAIDGCHAAVAAALGGGCGNGTLDPGEECDDGDTTSGDGCSADCIAEVPTPSRLAATATATSSGPAGGPHLAVDGNHATRWESAHGVDPSSITLDLGARYALSEVVIHWEAANAATYEIQGSADNSYWVTLSSRTGGVFGDRTDIVALAGTYRYVRMRGLTRTSPYGYSIWEIEVYGTPAADTDGDGVDDSIDLCPATPPGSAVDADGCVFVDTDDDGVTDDLDQCPGTPPSTPVDGSGCTVLIPVNEVTSIDDLLAGGSGSSRPGFTLYVFDNDLAAPGTSTCNGGCAATWPPLVVADGVATGVSDLGTIVRNDSSVQATHEGRPLYFFSGDSLPGDTNGDGLGGVWHAVAYVQAFAPLFDATTALEPELQVETPTALITRLADRARDRHAREDQFMQYDHYLSFYWEHRTAAIEIVDTVGKGGNTITFNVTTEWQLSSTEAELRFFFLGITTEAQYMNNGIMTAVPALDVPGEDRRHYTRSLNFNQKENRPLQVGDRLEFELSHFLAGVPRGRNNYYGTAILYIVGQGVVPFEAQGPRQDSFPMPEAGWLGGGTTLNYQYSNEPDDHFMQMPTNLSNINGQVFVLGRRVHHTDFGDGSHDESTGNPAFTELANLLGRNYVNRSCVACHRKNGRAVPPAPGAPVDQYVVKVGDAAGAADARIGSVLQPRATSGATEGAAWIASWTENNGLRSPNFGFSGNVPTNFSARIAPQLVGMGLLEAIDEADIQALADEADSDGDGISGRLRLVTDAVTGETRVGRFGWKASQPTVRQQVAAALNTDIGVMTSVFPAPDCGSSQADCGATGAELGDPHLDELTAYLALLGVSARRNLADPVALQGEALFATAGCTGCHVDTFQTSPFHPHAELRGQTIHPYTDLLLHDMGPGLASTLSEGNASASEWRTAPLWNIGLTAGVSGGQGYLHDGRARTLHEAILWHGGEAEAAKQAYDGLTQGEKEALLAFLASL
jgi:cysteine-rich repeat protein